jgi:hypothetical protein
MLAPFLENLLLLYGLLLVVAWALDVIVGWMNSTADTGGVAPRTPAARSRRSDSDPAFARAAKFTPRGC